MKKALLLCLFLLLAGCNTMNGVGQDLEKAGQGLGKVIDELKGK